MDKTADNNNLNIALLSLLGGAGTYAGLRGYREIMHTMNPPANSGQNTLELTLPKSKIPKTEEPVNKYANAFTDFLSNSAEMAAPVAIGAGGLYAGFKGAQGVNSYFNNKSLDDEKEKVKQQYLAALQRASTKTAEAKTPHLDAFINGIIDKKAEFYADGFKSLFDGAKGVAQDAAGGVMRSEPAAIAGGGGLLAGGAAALATYYLANRLDRNKSEAHNKSNIPTEIKLNVK